MNLFLKKIIVSGMGTGYLRPAPGTWGSAAAAAVYLACRYFTGANVVLLTLIMLAVAILSTVGCIALGDFMERWYGKKDPSHCTLDEWAGQAVAMMFLPCVDSWKVTLALAGLAFVFFRIFDILKPAPARNFERFSKGVGVVADDLVAGLYACVAVQLILKSPLLDWCAWNICS